MNSDRPKRILIVRLGGIGDVVCTLPALEAIRAGFPDAFIGYAVEERAYDIVNGHPALDLVHRFPRRQIMSDLKSLHWQNAFAEIGHYTASLHAQQYDLALDFQRNLKGAIHTIMGGARRKIGFSAPTAHEFNHWFHREHVDPAPAKHWADKFLAMATAIGGIPDAAHYRLPDAPESRKRVQQFLAANELDTFIAMHPGTSGFDLARRWEPERFGELAQRISTKYGFRTVVTWGPGEKKLAERIVEAGGGQAIISFKSHSLLDLAELYRHARIYIGCDTGPMHIATAVGLPSVVLFGSGNPAAYGPRSAGSKIVTKILDGRLQPMSEITIDEVFRASLDILNAS